MQLCRRGALISFTHAQLWRGIDLLAHEKGWSLPELATYAGLDPTSLNPSKRHGIGGKPHWPSTETLAKVLSAAGVTLNEFVQLM